MQKHKFLIVAILLAMLSPSVASAQCECSTGNCDYIITPGMSDYNFFPDELKAAMDAESLAGKRICIKEGTYPRLLFRYIEGTSSQPITIKNCDGVATVDGGALSAILIWDSKYIRLLGNSCAAPPENIRYGIRAKSETNYVEAKAILGRITDIEIAYLNIGADIDTVGDAGIKLIDEPGCDADTIKNRNSSQRHVIRNVLIHDNYIHNVGEEGTYIGKGSYFGQNTECVIGTDTVPMKTYSASLKGVRIYNNIVEHTGWDGIQLKDGDSDVKIYNNSIYNYGLKNKGTQNEGIIIGTSVGEVYHNRIVTGTGTGLFIKGLGNFNIHNNLIIDSDEEGIYLNGKDTYTPQTDDYIRVLNNTVVKTKEEGIWLLNYNYIASRVVANNIFAETPSGFTTISGAYTEKTNNVEAPDASTVGFVDYKEAAQNDFSTNDYHLTQNSIAVDSGKNASVYNADSISFDFDGVARNHGSAYDVGCFEYDGEDDGGGGTGEWQTFINAGGAGYPQSTSGGIAQWEGDQPHAYLDPGYNTYATGGTASFSHTNNTTAPNQVLGSYRYTLNTGTTIKYDIPIPLPGAVYEMEFFFARKNSDTYGSGARRFNIIVEGQTVSTYDVYDNGGVGGTGASSFKYSTAVNDGALEIKFVAVAGAHAQVNAIAVKKSGSVEPEPVTTMSLFMNAGGYEFEAETVTWEGDRPHETLDTTVITYATGGTASFSGENNTIVPDEVLGTNRFTLNAGNTIRYKIPVPSAGDYDVELYFARKNNETYTSGGRRFTIAMEGQTLTTYDIYDEGGPNGTAASSYVENVNVQDDTLEITLVATSGSKAQINALRVEGPVDTNLTAQSVGPTSAAIQSDQKLSVYPNPVTSFMELEIPHDDHYVVEIMSPRGQRYRKISFEGQAGKTERFDVSDLPPKQLFILQIRSSTEARTFRIFKGN